MANTLTALLGKTTQQAVLGLMVIGTACYLAITGALDGPTFLALATPVVLFLYRQPAAN